MDKKNIIIGLLVVAVLLLGYIATHPKKVRRIFHKEIRVIRPSKGVGWANFRNC